MMQNTIEIKDSAEPLVGKICLVTGCAGFVGSHLTQSLLDMGHSVLGVDNFFSGKPENMQGFISHERFTFFERSIAERALRGSSSRLAPSRSVPPGGHRQRALLHDPLRQDLRHQLPG
jgi:hypothetical protein